MSHVVGSDYARALHFLVDTLEQAISKHGTDVTYGHFMAEIAEAAARELPAASHYLRNAVDEADKSSEERKKEREAHITHALRGIAWFAWRSPMQGHCLACKRLTIVYKAYNGGQVLPVQACHDCADIARIPVC